ncbi:hypothetical protein QWZ10_15765 [Paracoccus cavernae]|uniref:Selenocysteine-specific elongation factor beta-barrel domain-containing protein n=1 Tax=Paracoccus cavernae TaxID=1571207 RepID=A0ABT8DAE1_9RHOB|nr:hypothetical protein [Paracoccus cavernae]
MRGIHMQNRKSDTGFAGQRCALNLAGEEISRDVITRGDVAMDPALHAPSQRLDIRLRLLASEPKPVITWTPARLHIGAAEVGARIVPLGGPLHPGEARLVQLVLDQPVAATAGDHLILRDVSARRTMGGGRVIDPHGPRANAPVPSVWPSLLPPSMPIRRRRLRHLHKVLRRWSICRSFCATAR